MRSAIVVVLLIIGFIVWMMIKPTSNGLHVIEDAYVLKSGQVITPIPETVDLDQSKVRLGRSLFHDTRLSGDNSISCSSCHDLRHAGQDGKAVSKGIKGLTGDVNSPTVFNSGFSFRQFWDGRAASLEDQIDGPTHNQVEMGSNWSEITAKLRQDQRLVEQFNAIWDDGITALNIKQAIAEFERSLITPNSPFDRYLKGDVSSLTEKEIKGWQLFRDLGCISCHQGIGIGNNMYANLGVMGDYFADRGRPIADSDLGRYNVTRDKNDRHVFKVPGLRNVALTAPYFHDGSISTLDDAVRTMARYQLGISLTPQQLDYLVAFLTSLTGEMSEDVP